MKTLVLCIVAIFIGMNIAKVHGQVPNYEATSTNTIYSSDIYTGNSNQKHTPADGAIKETDIERIVRYSKKGYLFLRESVNRFNEKTIRTSLMEVLTYEIGTFVLKKEHFLRMMNRWDQTFYFMANRKCLEGKRNQSLKKLIA